MCKTVFETSEEASEYIAAEIAEILRKKPNALLCFATGHTSLSVFMHLIALERKRQISFKEAHFVGLNEWLNVSSMIKGSCAHFLNENFFKHINAKRPNIAMFDALTEDSFLECSRIESFIEQCGGIDYMLLGMGFNGHLAFNEPGYSFSSSAHVVEFSNSTLKVIPKYFPSGMPPIKKGITLGMKNITESKKIHLAIFGKDKREAVSKLFSTQISEQFPATILVNANNAQIILDKAADGTI